MASEINRLQQTVQDRQTLTAQQRQWEDKITLMSQEIERLNSLKNSWESERHSYETQIQNIQLDNQNIHNHNIHYQ